MRALTAPSTDPESWRRALWAMVVVQFTMSIAFNMVAPIMPLFLPDLGVASPVAINLWAGVLASATSCIAIFAAPVWGGLADRYGRKLMVLRSTLGIGIFTLLMGVAHDPWQMLALRGGMGLLAGYNSAATVMVASQVPENRLGYAMGWMSTGTLTGTLIGPVIGGLIADLSGSYRLPFFVGGVICLGAFVTALTLVTERFTPPDPAAAKRGLMAGIAIVARSPALLSLIAVMVMCQFATNAVGPVVTLYVLEMLGDRPDIATLGGVAFSVTGVAGALAVPWFGRRSDRIGYRTTLMICLSGAALFTIPQAFSLGYPAFVAERFGLGLFIGGVLPAANALIGKLTDPAVRGTTYGLISSAYFIGNTTGPLTGGVVAASFGINWVFAVTAAILLANLVWVWLVVPDERRGQ